MGSNLDEKISLITSEIIKGNYTESLKNLNDLEQSNDLIPAKKIEIDLLRTRILIDLGEYKDALVIAINAFQQSEQMCEKLLMIDSKLSIIASLRFLGRFKEASELIKETEELILNVENLYNFEFKLQKARLFYNKGICARATGNQSLSSTSLLACIELYKELNNLDEFCDALDAKALYVDIDKDYNLSLTTLKESLALREKIGNKQRIANTYNRLGVVSSTIGQDVIALDYYEKGLKIAKEYDIKDLIGIIELNRGNISSKRGELEKALQSYLETQKYSISCGNKHMTAASYFNIADIYLKRGEIEKALEYDKLTLKEFEDLNFRQGIAAVLNHLGKVYFTKGNLELASTFFNESLSIREDSNNFIASANVLYNLVAIYLEGGLLEQAKAYHSKLENIHSLHDIPRINHQYYVSEAMLLKSTPRLKNRVKAEEFLRKVIEDDIYDHSITIDAYLLLCDLLLDELKLIGDRSVLIELTEYIDNLFDIAKEQQSHSLLAKTYLLKSHLALINFEVDTAKYLLSQAQFIAEEKELHGLAYKISREYDNLISHSNEWVSLAERNAPLNERLALITIDDVLQTMIGNKGIILPDVEQEDPVYLIIQNSTGKIIYTNEFHTLTKLDGALIGSFIAALNSFVKELFSNPGHIERIKHQDYTLVLKIHEDLVFTYVYKGQSYSSIKKLSLFIDTLSENTDIWTALKNSSISTKDLKLEENEFITNISETCFAA